MAFFDVCELFVFVVDMSVAKGDSDSAGTKFVELFESKEDWIVYAANIKTVSSSTKAGYEELDVIEVVA